MSGKQARKIRRHIYGDHSPRFREYRVVEKKSKGRIPSRRIEADARRHAYQHAKKTWRDRKEVPMGK